MINIMMFSNPAVHNTF